MPDPGYRPDRFQAEATLRRLEDLLDRSRALIAASLGLPDQRPAEDGPKRALRDPSHEPTRLDSGAAGAH
jgi:hypothetical protein